MSIPVLTCHVAGAQFTKVKEILADIKPGDPVGLFHELNNPYDPNAVRIEWSGRKIGYVPKMYNGPISRSLAAKEPLGATIYAVDPAEKLHMAVSVEIHKE